MKNRIKSLIVILSVLSAAIVTAMCTVQPIFIAPGTPDGKVEPGETIQYQIGLSRTVTGNQSVSINTNNPSAFSSLPSSVTVLNGQSSATFYATFNSGASGSISVTATLNGQSVDCGVIVVP